MGTNIAGLRQLILIIDDLGKLTQRKRGWKRLMRQSDDAQGILACKVRIQDALDAVQVNVYTLMDMTRSIDRGFYPSLRQGWRRVLQSRRRMRPQDQHLLHSTN